MNNSCLICNRIQLIKEGKNEYFVKEMKTGYVVLEDFQYYKGYVIFLSKKHVLELHQMDKFLQKKFFEEMTLVSEAIYKAFNPVKLNYELLGNSEPHVHWHIIPRYKNDPNPKATIWSVDKAIRYSEKNKIKLEDLQILKYRLLQYL